MSTKVQTWSRTIDGHDHHLEVTGEILRRFDWTVDGEEVLTRKTTDDRARLESKTHGSLFVVHSGLGTPRRATYFAPDEDLGGLTGIGGLDLTPEAGSRAAAYERRVIDHPKRYALIETLGGAAGVVGGIAAAAVIAWILSRISLPDIDLPMPNLPDLPDLPLPDLPSIPWPSIPWPDLPDVHVPGWLAWIGSHFKYVWPVILAFVVAQGEIKRRRKHAETTGARSSGELARPLAPSEGVTARSAEESRVQAEKSLPQAERAADDSSTCRSDASTEAEGQRRGL